MEIHHAPTLVKPDRQEIHIARTDLHSDIGHNHHHQVQHANVTIQQPNTHHSQPQTQIVTAQPQQMIITNGQLHNAQIINAAGQIVGTAPIQSTLATGQICQLLETSEHLVAIFVFI